MFRLSMNCAPRTYSRLLVGLISLCLSACGDAQPKEHTIRVFAASSLTTTFEAMAREFERRHADHHVELHFAGTPTLVLQLREGARAEVFASADTTNMQKIVDAGLVAGRPQTFAHNRLAIAVRRGNPRAVHALADLSRTELRVALCGPEVPAGRYARLALQSAQVEVNSVSDEPNVKALLTKLRLSEIDACIVYGTDIRGDDVEAIEIPEEWNVRAEYPIARLSSGTNAESGAAFLSFVLSSEGRALLREQGFELP